METLKKIGVFLLLFVGVCAIIGTFIAAIASKNVMYVIASIAEGALAVPSVIKIFKSLTG